MVENARWMDEEGSLRLAYVLASEHGLQNSIMGVCRYGETLGGFGERKAQRSMAIQIPKR